MIIMAAVVHIPLLSLHGIFEYEKGLLHLVNEFLFGFNVAKFKSIVAMSEDAEFAAGVTGYLPQLQALKEGLEEDPWLLSIVTGREGGPVLGCLEAFSLEHCFHTLSVRFKTLPKGVVEPQEHSEEDTRRRIDCLGFTDYEEVQVAEAKEKHRPIPQIGETSLHTAVRVNDLASVNVFIRCGQ